MLCGGTLLEPFVTPPDQRPGRSVPPVHGHPGRNQCCIVVETVDGRTDTVSVTVENRLEVERVPAGRTGTVEITDTYEEALGALVVRKTIRGPAAPDRGPITIAVDCGDDVDTPDIVIPPANTAGTQQYGFYTGIPAGTARMVTETEDGATATAVVTVTGSPQDVTIPARRKAVASLTDTYDYAPGSLIVRKTITGPKAGEQGEIVVICPVCDGVALAPFAIPANSPAGTLTRTYDDLPAGASCTGTETPNGSTDTVFVTIAAGPLPVIVPPGASVTASVTDTYQDAVVSVTVEKTIAGPAAGQQARIVIRTRCGDQTLPDFVIPAGEDAGTQSRTYRGLTPGEPCTVRELEDGGTDSIAVETSGDQEVTVPVIGTATAHLRVTFASDRDGYRDRSWPAG